MKATEIGKIALVATAFTLFGVGAVYAATTTVTATIKFVSDLTISQVTAMNFGYVQAATAGTYTLSTAGVVTPSGVGVTEGGPVAAGDYLISGSATQTITIKTSGYSANGGTSTPSLATCDYNSTGSQACDAGISVAAPGAAGKHVKLGLKVVTTGGADGSTDSPQFTLTVTYN
ncbi:MAG TPA: hypothetical protein VL625_08180 [Patescibacteria group bacterium]|nr:hypothetical protein [Patescibacteria group bacterium]